MPFVKLDCGMLNSTIWFEREAREVFITALLMAEPVEYTAPVPQIAVNEIKLTGFVAPAGWYGFVPASGPGIVSRAQLDQKNGLEALKRLGDVDPESRSKEFEGRRMIRVDGGYLILNYIKYRERDYSTAERSKRYRERKAALAASRVTNVTSRRDITQAEEEAEVKVEIKDKKPASACVGEMKEIPSWLTPKAWAEYRQHRKTMRKPLTTLAESKALSVLTGLVADGNDAVAVIDQSIANGWAGLFSLKGKTNGTSRPSSTRRTVADGIEEAERYAASLPRGAGSN